MNAKQRFIDLTVAEISVVDTPAVEVEFLVMKRQEDKMENTQPAATPAIAEIVENAHEPVSKTISAVRDLITDITKLTSGAVPAPASTPAATTESSTEEVDTAKAGDKKRAWAESQLKAAGLKGDDLAKAMAKYDEAFPPFPAKVAKANEEAPAQVAKSIEAPAPDATQETLDQLTEAISKAKRFTPKREETLKAIATQLVSLLKEMGMEEVPHCMPPATKLPSDASLGASGIDVAKTLEGLLGEVRDALAGVTTTTKNLEARVQTIEETRQAPKSAVTDTTTAPEPVKKSLWSGVL